MLGLEPPFPEKFVFGSSLWAVRVYVLYSKRTKRILWLTTIIYVCVFIPLVGPVNNNVNIVANLRKS